MKSFVPWTDGCSSLESSKTGIRAIKQCRVEAKNWLDADGSVTGFHVPSIIGSVKAGSQGWWQADDEGK
jgi:hypothetical protein